MLSKKFAIAGGAAALALLGATAVSAQEMNYEQSIQCSAMFFVFSQKQSEQDMVEALEAATGVMLNKAQATPGARNLTEDQVIEAAVAEAVRLEERISTQSAADAQATIFNWGPGMDRCLEVVLAE